VTRVLTIDGVLYAADSLSGRILAINLTDLSLDVVYNTTDDFQLHTVAASRQHVYFSAWNRKYVLECWASILVYTQHDLLSNRLIY